MLVKYLFLTLVAACNLITCDTRGEIEIECSDDTCSKCYKTLATQLLKNDTNYIELQRTFFPSHSSAPDFVIVTYMYGCDINDTILSERRNSTWFWSSSAYFFYHPLHVFQFTSLGFSNPSLKQTSMTLHLPASCYDNGTDPVFMELITQRLQPFAMNQKITGGIDSTYTAHSHSDKTLAKWHTSQSPTSRLLLSAQVIFPVLATSFITFFLLYVIEIEPSKLGKTFNNHAMSNNKSLKRESRSTVWIAVTVSIHFTLANITADVAAIAQYDKLPPEIKKYYKKDFEEHNISQMLRVVPEVMLAFDISSLILFIVVPITIACLKMYGNKCGIDCGHDFKWSDLLYTVISPLACLATHSYHIIFAFINNPYHATSILLLYIMTLFILVAILHKTYYSSSSRSDPHGNKVMIACKTIGYFVAPFLLAIPIGLTIAVLLTLPLNNAVDEASNQIYSTYEASVAVIAALITWKVLLKNTNSSFTVLTKAADNKAREDKRADVEEKKRISEWNGMTEKEKEIYIAKRVLSFIRFSLSDIPIENKGTQPDSGCTPFTRCCVSGEGEANKEAGEKLTEKADTPL